MNVLQRDMGRTAKAATPQSILVQRMITLPSRLKKYEPLDIRDFVDFSGYGKISISNIKEACEKFYGQSPGTCDIFLGDRCPSCYRTEQVFNKLIYFVCFNGGGAKKKRQNISKKHLAATKTSGNGKTKSAKDKVLFQSQEKTNLATSYHRFHSISQISYYC